MKSAKSVLIGVILGIGLYMFIFLVFHPFTVEGSSMEPTYHDQNLVISTGKFTKETLTYGDVVIVNKHPRVIKRIVALPGDEISIVNGYLYVNGELSEYNYAVIEDSGVFSEPFTVGEDQFVIMGDNRNNSVDSRSYGPVMYEEILYKVTKTII